MFEGGYMAHRQKMLHTPGLGYLQQYQIKQCLERIPNLDRSRMLFYALTSDNTSLREESNK